LDNRRSCFGTAVDYRFASGLYLTSYSAVLSQSARGSVQHLGEDLSADFRDHE